MADAGGMDLGLETIKSFAGKLIQAVTGFAGTLVFANELGATSFGGFYLLVALVFVVDRPMRGVARAFRKRYSEDDSPKRELVGVVALFNTAFLVVVGIGLWLFRHRLAAETNVSNAAVVFLALFASLSVFFPTQQVLSAHGWLSKQTWNDTVRSVFTFLFQFLFVSAGLSAAGMGYGLAAATLVVVPIGVYLGRPIPAVPSAETIRSVWEYARYSTPSALVGQVYERLDTLVLGVLVTTGAVGAYRVAFQLTVPASFLYGVIGTGLMPKLSNLHSKGEEIVPDINNAVSFASALAIPVFFGVAALPDALIRTLFSEDYAAAGAFLIVLGVFQITRSQALIQRNVINAIDRPDVGFRIDLAALVVNVLLGVWLVVTWRPLGVALATVVAESLRYGLSAVFVRRQFDSVSLAPRTLLEQVLAGGVMFLVVVAAKARIGIDSWVPLIGLVTLGTVVYGVVLVVVSSRVRFTVWSIYRDVSS